MQTLIRLRRAGLSSAVLIAVLAVVPASLPAQDKKKDDSKKKDESKVAKVEVTPAEVSGAIGDKIQFSAVGKDAQGKAQPDKVKLWFAAPFDTAGADQNGVVTLIRPGEVVVGASIGSKVGYAKIKVSKPHIARIDVAAPTAPLLIGGAVQLRAIPRNPDGDPRSDIALTWSSDNNGVAAVDSAGIVRGMDSGRAVIRAMGDGKTGEATVTVIGSKVPAFTVEPASPRVRTGDVVHFHAAAKDSGSAPVSAVIEWSVSGGGAQVWPDGAFVAERPGTYTVQARIGVHTAVTGVVVAPRNVARELDVVGRIMPTDTQFAEEWIWGNHAYYSTIGDKVLAYDVSDPANPKQTDTVKVDARHINDVSVTADGKIGVITREGASNRKNGIVFLDTSDPAHPKVISDYTETVTGGVHSAFIYSHYVFLTDDATGSLRVIDFADPKVPREVARWQTETSLQMQTEGLFGVETAGRYLHDDQVIDGIAYLAYWRDGLVILDVGKGIKGGSPEHPQLVSQFRWNYNELYGPGWLAGAHAVFRYENYVFVGDEVFPPMPEIGEKNRIPVRGILHVVDISDIEHPREVATYSVPEAGAHNLWVLDDILYMGYYNGGGRVLDVSGELRGELYNQGREIARLWTGDPGGFRPNLPFVWGGFPDGKGLIYFNDINSGLWIARLGKPKEYSSTTEAPR